MTERLLHVPPGLFTVTVFPEREDPVVLIFTRCDVPDVLVLTPVNEHEFVELTDVVIVMWLALVAMLLPHTFEAFS